MRLVIILNGALTNAAFNNVDTNNSCVEFDIAATVITGGIIIDSDYISTGLMNRTTKENGLLGRNLLSLLPNGNQSTLTIAAIRTGGQNASVLAGIKWKEIR